MHTVKGLIMIKFVAKSSAGEACRAIRHFLPRTFLCLLAVGMTAPHHLQAAGVKIMPIGDSITQSAAGHDSFRYELWKKLASGGFSFDFVGSMTKPYGGNYIHNSGWDMNHEGHWGWRADQISAGMGGWAAAHKPDIALLHIGSNDMNQNQSVASTLADIGNIITRLRAANPQVTILLAKVIPWNNSTVNNRIKALNAAIPAYANTINQPSSRVIVVDQYTGFSASGDTFRRRPPQRLRREENGQPLA